jgi:hypothetical protein
MPTYFARGVSLRLGAMPLDDTITPKVVLKKGEIAKRQCEEAERKLLGSELLPEERVAFPGDEAGFELNWLGDAPFMQVRAGSDLCLQHTDGNAAMETITGPKKSHVPSTPHSHNHNFRKEVQDRLALILHVNLSDKSFVSGLDKYNKVHLKIDVFFNGQLSSCLFVPHHDIRSGAKSLHQVFAGYRVDFLSERPWVILPPNKNADGSPRKMSNGLTVQERWDNISEVLAAEAEQRGTDEEGNMPPSARFLKALSSMRMPDQIQSIQESTSRSFGIIDVVITAGEGRKVTSGTTYLRKPQRLTDENFPLRPPSGDTVEGGFGDEQEKAKAEPPRRANQMTSEVIDDDAEGDSDPEYEPHPKRRALTPQVLSTKRSLQAALPSPWHNESRIEQVAPNRSAIQATSETSRSSPERGRSGPREYTGHTERHSFGNTPPCLQYSFGPFSSSSFRPAFTSRMHPSPSSLQSSDPTLRQNSPSDLTSVTSIDTPDFLSSPFLSFPRSTNMSPSHLVGSKCAQGSDANRARDGLGLDLMYTTPSALPRPGSVGFGCIPSSSHVAFWNGHYPTRGLQVQDTAPSHVPNMVPLSITPAHHTHAVFGGLPHYAPIDRRLSMPLPPTGLFSVPTKPRSSLSPSKRPRLNEREKCRALLVTRLTITGKNGAVIVDHHWANPQRIAARSNEVDSASGSSSLRSSANSLGASALTKSTTESRSDKMEASANSSATIAPQTTASAGLPLTVPKPTDRTKKRSSTTRKKADVTSQNAQLVSREASKPTMSRHRSSSNNNILGVQGPEGTTFWLEDPEEVLREAARAARLRRSRSSNKLNKDSSVLHIASAQVGLEQNVPALDSSSPLSSLATTPEPYATMAIESRSTAAVIATPTTPAMAVAQVDGPSDHKVIAISPAKITSSATKLASTGAPRLAPQPPSTPMASPSPNTKKRKSQARFLPKQPRSPDRLKTVSNPPLNRDCVIAFAESEDKDSDRGVLRQVRGERQGIFAEEYVVLATRFFIPGN